MIGTTRRGIIKSEPSAADHDISSYEFIKSDHETHKQLSKQCYIKKSVSLTAQAEDNYHVSHASMQILNRYAKWDTEKGSKKGTATLKLYYILAIVKKHAQQNSQKITYSSSIYLLLEEEASTSNSKDVRLQLLDDLQLIENIEEELKVHILSTRINPSEESDRDTLENPNHENDSEVLSKFTNLIVLLRLNQSITMYSVETSPSSTIQNVNSESFSSKLIHIEKSETLLKPFWWGQWDPLHEFLAFIHNPKRRQSSYEDDEESTSSQQVAKPLLSVLQFHDKFPRESVLNMPVDVDQNPLTTTSSLNSTLAIDPNVVSSPGSPQLKLLAHSSGAVYLLQIHEAIHASQSSETGRIPDIKYSVNCLHHNKTLSMNVRLTEEQKSRVPVRIDAAIYSTDQYLMIVGWPVFIHVLDVGTIHEPSHHLILDYSSIFSQSSVSPFLCISTVSQFNFGSNGDEKLDQSAKTGLTVLFEDMSHSTLELNSSVLLPLLEKADIKLKLSLIHFLLIHIHDINAAKRVTYDESKKRGNLHLKRIYQEFLLGHTFLQSKKQVVQNMESFLLLLPYCSDLDNSICANQSRSLTMELSSNCYDVSTFLLSPSQRVFPHNISDVWVCLWQLNRQFKRSKRFSHQNVAEKLGLSLQCYKPEALSRASTPGPMSPSSPMICSSLGDVTGLFGRRSTELQLPFVEHELCTANKQDYIFSINLRELSMHLLKERKEYPLQSHTVAGKYVWGLVESARLLCHLACLSVPLQQTTKSRDKGFKLIDSMDWTVRKQLFMLFEQYSLALVTLACPLPQGFTPFFAYLGYKVFQYDQFLWHVRAGTFDLQIDLVKTIMADLRDSEEGNVAKKLHLLSLLPKSRANRVLNTWSHPASIVLRARQHSSDLLSGVVSQNRKSNFSTKLRKKGGTAPSGEAPNPTLNSGKTKPTPLDTFFQLITAKANYSDIDLGLLTEATVISMDLL